jgi:hypothetical protein
MVARERAADLHAMVDLQDKTALGYTSFSFHVIAAPDRVRGDSAPSIPFHVIAGLTRNPSPAARKRAIRLPEMDAGSSPA